MAKVSTVYYMNLSFKVDKKNEYEKDNIADIFNFVFGTTSK